MMELAIILSIVAICLWFVTALVLFVVIIAMFRRSQALLMVNARYVKITSLMVKALNAQTMIIIRYERNLATWYNSMTGRTWSIDEKTRKEYIALLQSVDKLVNELKVSDQEPPDATPPDKIP